MELALRKLKLVIMVLSLISYLARASIKAACFLRASHLMVRIEGRATRDRTQRLQRLVTARAGGRVAAIHKHLAAQLTITTTVAEYSWSTNALILVAFEYQLNESLRLRRCCGCYESSSCERIMAPTISTQDVHRASSDSHPCLRTRRRMRVLMVVASVILHGESALAFVASKDGTVRRPCRCGRNNAPRREMRTLNYQSQANFFSRPTSSKNLSTSLFASAPDENNIPKQSGSSSERNLGVLVLCTVPLAWGTFEPAVRYVYGIEPAVPGFLFSVVFYLVAAVSLSTLAVLSMINNESNDMDETSITQQQEDNTSPSLPILGGIELGTYLFLGNGLQVLGLKTIPSDRAAFLLQLTTVREYRLYSIFARCHDANAPLDIDFCSISTGHDCRQSSSHSAQDMGSLHCCPCWRGSHGTGRSRGRIYTLFFL